MGAVRLGSKPILCHYGDSQLVIGRPKYFMPKSVYSFNSSRLSIKLKHRLIIVFITDLEKN